MAISSVQVGEQKEPFLVHKELITACSLYFKAVFDSGFREALDNSIHIEEATPPTFRTFLDWLYFRHFLEIFIVHAPNNECKYCSETNCAISPMTVDETYEKYVASTATLEFPVIDLYAFADRYNVPQLRHEIMDKYYVYYRSHHYPTYAKILRACSKLPSTTPLLELFKNLMVSRWTQKQDELCNIELKLREKLPADFLLGVMLGMGRIRDAARKEKIALEAMCTFHEHAQDKEAVDACKQVAKKLSNYNRTESAY
ncbi:hypothetical protein EJ08DRAFT_732924 [Tothia fuscella]|uniref:BTB domain-containing protein n=1 Tax=Tothia fuscella TaxID=1048955 RepID=A0A9P4NV19_9PEZI|nr:hypothetical protein EJ08DRAFT_732924 [Tothia fuscella]